MGSSFCACFRVALLLLCYHGFELMVRPVVRDRPCLLEWRHHSELFVTESAPVCCLHALEYDAISRTRARNMDEKHVSTAKHHLERWPDARPRPPAVVR